MPDLVIRRDGEAAIVGDQVLGMSVALEKCHAHKVTKYSDPGLLRLAQGGCQVSPIVTCATVSDRGVWSESSAQELLNLGLTKQDLKILTARCLQGTCAVPAYTRG